MFFYVKVVIEVFKCFFEVNVFIDGDDIVYYNYFDIFIVVFMFCGFVMLVFKDIDMFGMVGVEKGIKELVFKGCDGKLFMVEL